MLLWSKRSEQTAPPPPGIDDRKDKTKSNTEMLKASQVRMGKLQSKI